MAFNFDATGIGQLALRLGLASQSQVDECLIELDNNKAPAVDLVRLLERKRYLSAWQGAKLLKGETEGYFLGGYRLLYRIASGSFGRVYRGDDPLTGQVVAVKVLRNKWMMDRQKVDLFLREGKIGMEIRHPNIVSVLTVNQDNKTGQYFIVMEFIEGGNLRDLLQIRKKLTPEESARIIEESAQGLAYSFQRGMTHRDIKPTNILIAVANGQAKLVDFGLAEISDGNATGRQVGKQEEKDKDYDVAVDRTVDYAGLEKATNQKAGDVRSDIYFLGSVLFECVTGTPLMPATRDRIERMQARRYQEVEATLRRNGPALGVPPPLLNVLAKALRFDPNQRYQTPTEFVEALQACRAEMRGESVEVSVNSRIPPGPKTLFAIEKNERLKEAFREKFKAQGFRVLISIDPDQALKRYRQQPYHALIVDAGSIGDEGIGVYNQLLAESDATGLDLVVVLLLSQEQVELASEANVHDRGAVMVFPVSMRELMQIISDLMPAQETEEESVED
ncbi:MAG: serine/threonine protein kinase [Planctomycetaceae bacterium]|nr:serine/threonine protein kinase [Planctomycetaceae bacterium]